MSSSGPQEVLCGLWGSWGERSNFPQACREHPSKPSTTLSFLCGSLGLGERLSFLFHTSELCTPFSSSWLASDLPADFFPGLTGWVKRERSPEPRHTFFCLRVASACPHPECPQLWLCTFSGMVMSHLPIGPSLHCKMAKLAPGTYSVSYSLCGLTFFFIIPF